MPTETLSMRKIKQILQLHYESGMARRAISVSVGTSYGSVANYINRAEKASINWESVKELDERDLAKLLLPNQTRAKKGKYSEPDFSRVHQDLLLWEEYRQAHPNDGYSYSDINLGVISKLSRCAKHTKPVKKYLLIIAVRRFRCVKLHLCLCI